MPSVRLKRFSMVVVLVITNTCARATTFTVDSTADDGDANPGDGLCATATSGCTLRAAVEEADDPTVSPDTIVLPAGTYVTGGLQIRDAITIIGAGADSSIIDGGGSPGVIHVERLAPGN